MVKVIFMGTPEFSVNILKALVDSKDIDVVLVVTKKDNIVKKKVVESPVAKFAHENNIDVLKLESFKDEKDRLESLNPDLIVTAAYGKILPEYILDIPKYASINVHASLLPKYRGSSPIEYALKNGDKETGVAIMYMDKGMDTGDIIKEEKVSIDSSDNLDTLTNKLSIMGSKMIVGTIKEIVDGSSARIKQDNNLATYTKMITREDEHLDFNDTSLNIFNKVRSLSEVPGAYVNFKGNTFKIYSGYILSEKSTGMPSTISKLVKDGIAVNTKDYLYVITKVKPFGKNKMDAKSYINGLKENIVGECYE